MKNSIKRAQSQACLGFAERKNFRPLAKLKKLSLTLALLITAAAGAWADVTPVSVAGNWLNPQWDETTNQMAYKDGVYSITFSNMPAGQNYEFKFALNNSWDVSYGYSSTTAVELNKTLEIATQSGVDTNIKFDLAEACDVTISFNLTEPRTFMISTSGLVIGEDDKAPIKVAYNTAKTTASFEMPTSDVTATYTIKRDMTVDVAGEMADRIRIQMVDNAFQAVDATQMNPVVKDNLDQANPVTLTETTDYTLQLQKQSDTNADEWTDATALSVGNFRYKITGAGNYSGICYSEEFALYQGYEVRVPAGEYVTFYAAEALKEEDDNAELYTITEVNETAATATLSDILTVAPAGTPLLVKNISDTEKTFLLLPTDGGDNVTAADEFKGTLEATQVPASSDNQNNYAFNGKEFVWVKNALNIPANKAWLEIGSTPAAGSRTVKLVFGNSLTGIEGIAADKAEADGDGNWYDLNGRKLNSKPTTKGVYINNGRKVVIK